MFKDVQKGFSAALSWRTVGLAAAIFLLFAVVAYFGFSPTQLAGEVRTRVEG